MSEPTINIPLLRKAVEWAEAEAAKPPDLCEWEQGTWVATERYRNVLRRDQPSEPLGEDWQQRLIAKSPECGTCFCIAGYIDQEVLGNPLSEKEAEGAHSPVPWRAAQALGIASNTTLFDPDNIITDVRRIAEDIAGERL